MFRLAARLGVLVEELESRISRSEFVEWMAYEEIETERHEKIDYYLAQIAYCSMLPHMKKGGRMKLNDCLIKFRKPTKKKLSAKQLRDIVCGWFGVNPNKKKGVKNGG